MMAPWLTLTVMCLVYVALGYWVVSRIFPSSHDVDHDAQQSAPAQQQESSTR